MPLPRFRRSTARARAAVALLALSLVASVLGLAGTVQPAAAQETIHVTGHGWGHGRGMGQYGALGYARDSGWGYRQILGHFYGNTNVANVNGATPITVWLKAMDGKPVQIYAHDAFTVNGVPVDGTAQISLEFDQWVLRVAPRVSGTNCRTNWGAAQVLAPSATHIKVSSPVDPGSDPWRMLGICNSQGGLRQYRGGLTMLNSTTTRVINEVAVDAYLGGVVPRESPSSWPAEALKAQAVAARSYALSEGGESGQRFGFAKTCDDTQCQVYGGAGQNGGPLEAASTNAAISATFGEVRRYGDGRLARTEFSSSTGGWTSGTPQCSACEFPSVQDLGDNASPYHDWSADLSPVDVANAYGVGTLTGIEILSRNGLGAEGGRVLQMRINGTTKSVTITGDQFRQQFELRSNWFSVGNVVAPPQPPPPPRTPGDSNDFRVLAQPVRVLETRSGFPGYVSGTGKPAGGSVTRVQVAGGSTGVPSGAAAVSITVTGVESVGNDGYVTVWDCADHSEGSAGTEPDPPFTSNLNLANNDIRPNAVITKIGADNQICVFTRNASHLLVDINGYFPATSLSSDHLRMGAPQRILDTRPGSLVNHTGAKPGAGQVLRIPVSDASEMQILNITGVDASGAGWLTVWDCADANPSDGGASTEPDQPNVSALNLHPGVIAANLVFTRTDGAAFCIYTSHGTHVVVDKLGSFPGASDFDPVTPTRILETRSGPLNTPAGVGKTTAGGKIVLTLTDKVPGAVTAVAINVTGTDSASGYVSVYPCGSDTSPTNPPNASNLNLVAGQTRPSMAIVAVSGNDRICIYTQNPTHLVADLVGVFTAGHPSGS